MTIDEFRRVAALVAVSQTLSVDAMSAAAGVEPDRSRSKGEIRSGAPVPAPAKESSWEIRECGGRTVPLSEVVDRLFARAFPMRQSFIALQDAGCEIKLELMQWISASDPHGPGFALDAGVLGFLAEIGAIVDVDQYVE